MKRNIYLILIILFTVLTRLLFYGQIPPFTNGISYFPRLICSFLGIGNVVLMYYSAVRLFKNTKTALLSSFVFSCLPWAIEQGRIYSQANIAVYFLLVALLLCMVLKRPFIKTAVITAFFLSLYFIYPQLWVFRTGQFLNPKVGYLANFFTLTSPTFLFFRNNTFWWGGVRETGVMLVTFLPFFIAGIYELYILGKWRFPAFLGFILVISAASPYFPESREFFLAAPLISIIIALGFRKLFKKVNLYSKIVLVLFLFLFMYDFGQFIHYYSIHYPQRIMSDSAHLNEIF
jgi:hypothetical protein